MNRKRIINLKSDWVVLFFFFLLPIIFLYRGLCSSNEITGASYTDLSLIFFSTRSYGFSCLKGGLLPLWNPYQFGGMPFIASLHPAIFYPLNLIFLLFPINHAINWSISLHLTLSGTFTYYLLRDFGLRRFGATVAGIIYTFSAPQIMHIYAGHLNALGAMVWTPLMFLFMKRFFNGDGHKYGLFLSITIALQLLAGHPQYFFYSLIAVSFYLLFSFRWLHSNGVGWNRIGLKTLAFAAFILLALLLSAVQILPTAEMTGHSTRTNLSYEWVSTFSFPPQNLITFLIPDFFGDMLSLPYWGKNYLWEMTGYVGILPLLLAVIAIFWVRKRTVWFFTFLALFSLILAMGKYTPLLKLLYTYVPGFNLFRGSSKWLFLNAFSIAVVSGLGADWIIKGPGGLKNRRLVTSIITPTLLVIACLALMLIVFNQAWFKQAITGFETLAFTIFRDCAFRTTGWLLLGTAILLLYAYKRIGRAVFMASLFAVIILDLFSFGMRYMVTFDKRDLYWDEEVLNFLDQEKEPFRAIMPETYPNSGMVSGIETPNGYDTIMLKRYSEFINLSQGLLPDKQNLWVNITRVNKLTDLLNLKYIVLPSGTELNIPHFKSVFDNGRHSIYQNLNALPRAFVVGNVKIIRGRNAIFKEMISPEFDPTNYAVVEEEIDGRYLAAGKSGLKGGVVKFIHYSPNKVLLKTQLRQPGLLILGDLYYPGWKAYLDNNQTKIYRANYIMRAITLPKGSHLVEFRYQPFSFKLGAAISLVTFISFIFLIFLTKLKK